ncbi:MAG: hypothetical protein ACRYFX_09340 [Janthinobacterium lividum]
MRHDLLQSLPGEDALAQLFNQYLKGLSTLIIISEPTYSTMAEVRQYTVTAPKTKYARNHRHCANRYYEMTILRSSLEHIHANVLAAIDTLEGFFTTYGEDLRAYAIDNRQRSIDEYGSDDETDWYRDNEEDESEPWKIVGKTSREALSHYTLHDELGRWFGGESSGRGEYIGTSQAVDFYPTTAMVAQQSEFSFRKMAEGAWGATLVQVNEDGTQVPFPLADQIEQEMNEDIRNEALVRRFDTILDICYLLRKQYLTLDSWEVRPYRNLLAGLKMVRDVDITPVS